MMMLASENSEIQNIRGRYIRRSKYIEDDRYDALNPAVYMSQQEKERAIIKCIKYAKLEPLCNKRLIEIGCGVGTNLLQCIKFGIPPENLAGVELLEERALSARKLLPSAVKIHVGDASCIDLPDNSFDIVLQATVFTSILEENLQYALAKHMWSLLKPGGGVLWYDFIYNNPRNPDVVGIRPHKVRRLFPNGNIKLWHLTLAPPISRIVTKIHPTMYTIFNIIPFLRTHILCWIEKPL